MDVSSTESRERVSSSKRSREESASTDTVSISLSRAPKKAALPTAAKAAKAKGKTKTKTKTKTKVKAKGKAKGKAKSKTTKKKVGYKRHVSPSTVLTAISPTRSAVTITLAVSTPAHRIDHTSHITHRPSHTAILSYSDQFFQFRPTHL
jgi:hypothetical protein